MLDKHFSARSHVSFQRDHKICDPIHSYRDFVTTSDKIKDMVNKTKKKKRKKSL